MQNNYDLFMRNLNDSTSIGRERELNNACQLFEAIQPNANVLSTFQYNIYMYGAFRINRNHNRLHKAIVVNKSNKYLLPWFCFHNFAAFSIRREKPGFCLPSSLNSIFRFSHRWIIINCYDFIVFSICKQFSIVCKR